MESRLAIVILLTWGLFLSQESGLAISSPVSQTVQSTNSAFSSSSYRTKSRAIPLVAQEDVFSQRQSQVSTFRVAQNCCQEKNEQEVFRPTGEPDVRSAYEQLVDPEGQHDTRFRPLDEHSGVRRIIKRTDPLPAPATQPDYPTYYVPPLTNRPFIYAPAPLPRW